MKYLLTIVLSLFASAAIAGTVTVDVDTGSGGCPKYVEIETYSSSTLTGNAKTRMINLCSSDLTFSYFINNVYFFTYKSDVNSSTKPFTTYNAYITQYTYDSLKEYLDAPTFTAQ